MTTSKQPDSARSMEHGTAASPLPPLTKDEKYRAFEWLRDTALSTRPEARHAYVARGLK